MENTLPVDESLIRRIRAIGKRLPHALLLTGRCGEVVEGTALHLAAHWLGREDVGSAADYFPLRPRGKMRQIPIDAVRELLAHIHKSSHGSGPRIVHVHSADRLHRFAAAALLKFLEEPPASVRILLSSTRPYEILPTIRSRCHLFRSRLEPDGGIANAHWQRWLGDYAAFLSDAFGSFRPERILDAYTLSGNFQKILRMLPLHPLEGLSEEEATAAEDGQRRGLREMLLRDCSETTFQVFLKNLPEDGHRRRLAILRLAGQIRSIGHASWLLAMNASEAAALEQFLLPQAGLPGPWASDASGEESALGQ
jgi:DNA polymerase-3 subunit delta'